MQEMHQAQEAHGRAPVLLTAEAVSRLLHVDPSTVCRMAGDGRLPAVKVGRQWRFPAAPIEDLLAGAKLSEGPGVGSPLDASLVQPVLEVTAELLGVMMVVTDMSGRPVCRVANPCPRFLEQEELLGSDALLDRCLDEWRPLADDPDLEPRFRTGPLGFECARAFVRQGSKLVAMVLAGGVAGPGEPTDGGHVLDEQQRQQVLATLPKVAATLSRVMQDRETPRPFVVPSAEGDL